MKRRIALVAMQWLTFLVVYFAVAYIASLRTPHISWFVTTLDRGIPFVPAFVWAYISIYFLGTAGLCLAARRLEEKEFEGILAACYLNLLLFSLCHILFPRMAVKPVIDSHSVSGAVMVAIQRLTTAYNTLPSAHVSYSLITAWTAWLSYSKNRILSGILIANALLVMAATLLVKEHTVLDVLGGICVGTISIVAAKAIYWLRAAKSIQ